MDRHDLQNRFLSGLKNENQIALLFNLIPEVYFFAKDRDGTFMMVNSALVCALGLENESQIIGRNDYDFFEPRLADRYREEDRRVMRTRQSVVNEVWHVPGSGRLNWYLSSKVPLLGRRNQVVGVAGAMRDVHQAGAVLAPYAEMTPVIQEIDQHHGQTIEIGRLADMVELSVSQFERRFKKLFGSTPLTYLTKTRIDGACRDLVTTEDSIATIAHRRGFYDHSYFVKQFRKHLGMTPSAYRRRDYAAP